MNDCYEPQDLRVLYAAFDVAAYHLNVGSNSDARREKLARACIKWFDGNADAARIADEVVRHCQQASRPL
jgi:hypothetical protein